MTVYLPVWHSHCTRSRFTVVVSCSDKLAVHLCPLFCLQRRVAKLANRLFCCWSLLCNNSMATNLWRFNQARNHGGEALLRIFVTPPWKNVGHSLKILDLVQNILTSLGKLFSPSVSQAGYGPGFTSCYGSRRFVALLNADLADDAARRDCW